MGIKEESSWKTLKKKNDDYYGEHNEYPAEGKASRKQSLQGTNNEVRPKKDRKM